MVILIAVLIVVVLRLTRSTSVQAGRVVSVHVHPIKSCRGIAVGESAPWPLDRFGLRWDRRWMVVNADTGDFLTQRQIPGLSLVEVALVGDDGNPITDGRADVAALVLQAPSASDAIRVPLLRSKDVPEDQLRTAIVFGTSIEGTVDQGAAVGAWLSRVLLDPLRPAPDAPATIKGGVQITAVRLVFFDDAEPRSRRTVKDKFQAPSRAATNDVAFMDGFPFLVANVESLRDLNGRMTIRAGEEGRAAPEPLRMNRFRPNVVVEGPAAWEEDAWRRVRIGSAALTGTKKCTRCVLTTTNQETGDQAGVAGEPLATLRTFRASADRALCFGIVRGTQQRVGREKKEGGRKRGK